MFRRLPRKQDWVAVLRACPVSPDDVPLRRRAWPGGASYGWLLDTDGICQPA